MEELVSKCGIAHVGFIVADREIAVKRLSELYNIEQWFYVEFKPFNASYRGVRTDSYYLRCAISLPDQGTRLEVLEPVSEGFHLDILHEGVQTMHHICHIVEDYEKYRDAFLDKGTNMVFEAEMEDAERGYRRCCYVYDALLKTVVEIAEKPYFRERR